MASEQHRDHTVPPSLLSPANAPVPYSAQRGDETTSAEPQPPAEQEKLKKMEEILHSDVTSPHSQPWEVVFGELIEYRLG